jgi:uncharacterized protein
VISLESVSAGTILSVRAQPSARRNALIGLHDGALRVAISAPPDKGRANQSIEVLLAKTFDLPRSAVELISGQTARQKRFLLKGITTDQVQQKLALLLAL